MRACRLRALRTLGATCLVAALLAIAVAAGGASGASPPAPAIRGEFVTAFGFGEPAGHVAAEIRRRLAP